ncbi:hypothetical protein BC832DRAFT_542712 [Gaertneriomyces semiglobifer]|nr:hypothetical protein BC832DRAFT_542712 [Gaertneriomyces semiglobifer]
MNVKVKAVLKLNRAPIAHTTPASGLTASVQFTLPQQSGQPSHSNNSSNNSDNKNNKNNHSNILLWLYNLFSMSHELIRTRPELSVKIWVFTASQAADSASQKNVPLHVRLLLLLLLLRKPVEHCAHPPTQVSSTMKFTASFWASLLSGIVTVASALPQDPPAPGNAGAPPECVAAADSNLCGDFVGAQLDLRTIRDSAAPFFRMNFSDVTSVGLLDSAIMKQIMPAEGGKPKELFEYFGCPSWDGGDWRYRLTVMCGYFVSQSNKCPGNTGNGNVCPDAWAAFQASGLAALTNATRCGGQAHMTQVETLFGIMQGVIPAPASSPSTCVTSRIDQVSCGFANHTLSNAFCAPTSSGTPAQDTCCSSLSSKIELGAPRTPASTPSPSSTANSDEAKCNSGDSSACKVLTNRLATGVIIAIAAGGAALLILLIAGLCIYFRRKNQQKNALWKAHTNLARQSVAANRLQPSPVLYRAPGTARSTKGSESPSMRSLLAIHSRLCFGVFWREHSPLFVVNTEGMINTQSALFDKFEHFRDSIRISSSVRMDDFVSHRQSLEIGPLHNLARITLGISPNVIPYAKFHFTFKDFYLGHDLQNVGLLLVDTQFIHEEVDQAKREAETGRSTSNVPYVKFSLLPI